MCLEDSYLNKVKELNYIPVGLKNNNFSEEWLRDNTLENIAEKNSFYGEYTFYYWYWKNRLKFKKKDEWVGFCSYRELWGQHKNIKNKKIDGLNVTFPFKEEAAKLSEIKGEEVELTKSSNLLIFKDKITARNTDLLGFEKLLNFHFLDTLILNHFLIL